MAVEGIQGLQPLRNIFAAPAIEGFKTKQAYKAVELETHKPIGFNQNGGQSSGLPQGALGNDAIYAHGGRLGGKLNYII